jgi:hypothetical protein
VLESSILGVRNVVRAVLLKLKCMYRQHGIVIYCPCFG